MVPSPQASYERSKVPAPTADTQRGTNSVATDDIGARFHGVGEYLTNGAFLYRVADLVLNETHGIVELEDCYSLDVVYVRAKDLSSRRLRVVAPAPADN
jgi:hypothetical protein